MTACGSCVDMLPPADLACAMSAACGGGTANLCTDSHNCGACNHDCQGGACTDGVCQAVSVATMQVTPWELAVDSANVYWTTHTDNMVDGFVMQQPKSSSTATPLASTQWGPREIITAGGNLYWENLYAGEIWQIAPAPTGTAVNVVSAPGQVTQFAVDSANAYYLLKGGDVIYSVPLGGGGSISTLTNPALAGRQPVALATDGTWVYWINNGDQSIQKTPVGGGAATPVATGLSSPGILALFGNQLYFTAAGSIMEVSTVSGAPQPVAGGFTMPVTALAVDADGVYWAQYFAGAVGRLSFASGVQSTVAMGQMGPQSVATDATTIYWVDVGTIGMNDGAIMKAAK
jgi:hypothetical protein